MEKDDFNEHPLDSMLDDESEVDFGEPEIRDRYSHGADENASGNLKDWSAQDFASIYVRFRPHLERHARRYLSNQVQAEEVVQDAFLYLMTTLPELDSELGVLKFLKWKIRLLSLDVLRSTSSQRETSTPDLFEFVSDDQEFTEDIERAEDNAVIRLALAKLNPRQREALIASVYEEKSSEEVAEQLGLSPNATRQLVFRARSAFKKALVGEAEIQGKSISQVLTIAAKKAAIEVKENAMKVGAFILLAAVGLGVLPQLIPSDETVVADAPAIEAPVGNSPLVESTPEETSNSQTEPYGPEDAVSEDEAEAQTPVDETGVPIETAKETEQVEELTQSVNSSTQVASALVEETEDPLLIPQTFGDILSTTASSAFYYQNSKPGIFESFDGESIQIFAGTGVSAFLDYRPEELTIYNAILQLRVEGESLYAIPTSFEKKTNYDGTSFELIFQGSNFYLVREDGTVVSDSIMSGAESRAAIKLNTDGEIISTSLDVSR